MDMVINPFILSGKTVLDSLREALFYAGSYLKKSGITALNVLPAASRQV
jgi:hypothetical protein